MGTFLYILVGFFVLLFVASIIEDVFFPNDKYGNKKTYAETLLGKFFVSIALGIQKNVDKQVAEKNPELGKKLQEQRKRTDDVLKRLKKKRKRLRGMRNLRINRREVRENL